MRHGSALGPPDEVQSLPRLTLLDLEVPAREPGGAPIRLDPKKPLSPDRIGLLAILNNPDLVGQRGNVAIAEAEKLAASLLPNPSATLGYAFLLAGPGTADAITASLSQDIQSIVIYRPKVAAAAAHVHEVKANLLWQEWQVAQKARLLAVGIYWSEREIGLREHELKQLAGELAEVRAATAAGNLAFTAEAPLLAANATAERDLATARLALLKDWQDLDALLGLQPSVRFAISAPPHFNIPNDINSLIASLPTRRPDLIALQLGYDVASSEVRVAILSQFPPFSLGLSGGSDTTQVVSLGPQVAFELPIFNHNQAKIASAEATRTPASGSISGAARCGRGDRPEPRRSIACDHCRPRAGEEAIRRDRRHSCNPHSALIARATSVSATLRITRRRRSSASSR